VVNLVSRPPFDALLARASLDAEALRATAEAEDRLWVYGEEESLEFADPVAPYGIPAAIEVKLGRHVDEAPFVAALRDGQLVGPGGVTLASDGRYVLGNTFRSESLLVRSLVGSLAAGVVPRRRRADRSLEVAMSMVGPWARGYFHWFSEYLPRLEGVEHYRAETGQNPTLLVPPDPPAWMTDSLHSLGYGPDAYVEWGGGRVTVERLVVPSVRRAWSDGGSSGYTNSPRGYRWVRETVLSNLEVDRSKRGNERIFISRAAAAERRVVNEDAVVAALAERGFRSYRLEEHTFAEQVALFADADAVVAPHGAGLVNAMFGDEMVVVELFGNYENACYFTLAQGLDLVYACLPCESVGPDLHVDLDRLNTVLDQVLD
jgi:hypothetical protein